LPQNVVHYRRHREIALDNPTWWWLLAGALVALELITGTFYLLMLALGGAAAALAAHAGAGVSVQIACAAVVGLMAVVLWHLWRQRSSEPTARAQRSVNLDIGEQLLVDAWTDGVADVKYRGAQWQAICRHAAPSPGLHRVVELQGNRLVLEPVTESSSSH
jgi:membrane protein implicated in regulation of membrane protease activity